MRNKPTPGLLAKLKPHQVARIEEQLAIELASAERGGHPADPDTHRGVPAWWVLLPEGEKDKFKARISDGAIHRRAMDD